MIKTVNIKEVKSNPDNPRFIKDHKFKKLVQSLKDFPEMLEKRPMVVDENMVVLGGNMRLKACSAAGFDKVHIVIAKGWSEEQKRQFIIKDNVSYGEWDWDILANAFDNVDLAEWGLDVWQPEKDELLDEPYSPQPNFEDEGVGYKEQYGVIVNCPTELEQEKIFSQLTKQGYKCKIVVT